MKFRVWFTIPSGFERIIDIEAGDRVSAIDGARKQVPEGSELRYAGELRLSGVKERNGTKPVLY